MSRTSLSIHPKASEFRSEVKSFDEFSEYSFHVLELNADERNSVHIFFHSDQDLINALQDLKVTCENKIWDLTAIPSEYEDYAREPF